MHPGVHPEMHANGHAPSFFDGHAFRDACQQGTVMHAAHPCVWVAGTPTLVPVFKREIERHPSFIVLSCFVLSHLDALAHT